VVKKKVVLDTNVLISSLLKPKSKARDIYRLVLRGEVELYISVNLISELSRVLEYPKFKFEKLQKEVFLKNLMKVATVLVDPKLRVNVIKEDPPDNKLLECAVEAKADYLISGDNEHLLPLENFQGIKIINPSEFLKLYQKPKSKHS